MSSDMVQDGGPQVIGRPAFELGCLAQEQRLLPVNRRRTDRYIHTLAIMCCGVVQYGLNVYPASMPLLYALLYPAIYCQKLHSYWAKAWHGFLMDFCYFANTGLTLFTFLTPRSCFFAGALFLWSTGPLVFAIPVWRNSIVFHDVDKLSTIVIHTLPMLVFWTLRWYPSAERGIAHCPAPGAMDLFVAMVGYLLWQVLYLIVTEVILAQYLNANAHIFTSLRWVVQDERLPSRNGVLAVVRKMGIFGPRENFVVGQAKTTLTFVTSQSVYTLFTFLPALLIGENYLVHSAACVFVILISVYNGACFYTEVFARRYIQDVNQQYAAFVAAAREAGRIIADSSDTFGDDPDAPPAPVLHKQQPDQPSEASGSLPPNGQKPEGHLRQRNFVST